MLIDALFSTNENLSSEKTDQSQTRGQYVSLGSVNNRNHMVRSENPTRLPRDSRDVFATKNILLTLQIFSQSKPEILFRLLRITKTLRIIRIFKLARHSTGLQALGTDHVSLCWQIFPKMLMGKNSNVMK